MKTIFENNIIRLREAMKEDAEDLGNMNMGVENMLI